MADKKKVIGNLKMNLMRHELNYYFLELKKKLQEETPEHQLGLALPYIYLEKSADELESTVQLLAQDVHHLEKGAYTSSISATQLSSINIKSTLIGHSECRSLGQTEDVISKKIRIALLNGFNVVYCCGKDPLREIKNELFFISPNNLEKLSIAFEPLSAIGSGSAMPPELVTKQLEEIRNLAVDMWGEAGRKVPLLYGGSVSKDNYKSFLSLPECDGILVGTASLNIDNIWDMAMNR
ncbi:triosephosphate isomerase [Mycoplasma ovis str. Michigan]|uniref:Triosephosphate isomerase n=1 Tax=Mycoplasma ovis str. Michigan TaxID=1415773 RepID=A0ABM5P0T6_9MOLU|nr:triose-phosphate isomerase family protein [Mycoplasma ovis]AHC40044.1 triosephosphate isomerase [Mycoplasma ovis str. Michigan]